MKTKTLLLADLLHPILGGSRYASDKVAARLRDAIYRALVDGVAVFIPRVGTLVAVKRAAFVSNTWKSAAPVDVPARKALVLRPANRIRKELRAKTENAR